MKDVKMAKYSPRHYKSISECARPFSADYSLLRKKILVVVNDCGIRPIDGPWPPPPPQSTISRGTSNPGNIFVSLSRVVSVINQINSRNNVTGASMHRIWDGNQIVARGDERMARTTQKRAFSLEGLIFHSSSGSIWSPSRPFPACYHFRTRDRTKHPSCTWSWWWLRDAEKLNYLH